MSSTTWRSPSCKPPRRTIPDCRSCTSGLGLTYLKKQNYEQARDQFLKDAAVEPDLALNYDELGDVYSLMHQDGDAEKNYREALRRDPRLKREMETSVRTDNQRRAEGEKQVESGTLPSPELTEDEQ